MSQSYAIHLFLAFSPREERTPRKSSSPLSQESQASVPLPHFSHCQKVTMFLRTATHLRNEQSRVDGSRRLERESAPRESAVVRPGEGSISARSDRVSPPGAALFVLLLEGGSGTQHCHPWHMGHWEGKHRRCAAPLLRLALGAKQHLPSPDKNSAHAA